MKADTQEMVSRFAAGETIDAIARSLGLNPSTVRYRLIKAGVHRPKKNNGLFDFTPEQVEQIRTDYPTVGCEGLAKRFGCSEKTVRQKAYTMGVKMLRPGERRGRLQAQRNTTVNLTFFDTWTPEMAYVLGYIWADGSIRRNRDQLVGLGFLCTKTDMGLIEQITAAMGCTGKFRPHHARDFEKTNSAGRKTKRHSKDAVIYEINSVVIARKLINDHGILPNKSALDLPYPNNIPDEFLSHFARGNLDGDGTVWVAKDCKRAYIRWIGKPLFVHGIGTAIARVSKASPPIICNHSNGLLVAVWTAKTDILRIGEWVYRDATICLERKREKFRQAQALLASVQAYSKRRRGDGTTVTFTE